MLCAGADLTENSRTSVDRKFVVAVHRYWWS